MSDIWLNLDRFNDLFFYMPDDVKATFLVLLVFFIALGAKRIFLG